MSFEPLDARELAQQITKKEGGSKWGHPKYTSVTTSQQMRTLCEAVIQLDSELRDLKATISSPRTDEFFDAVRVEAAHQIDRWGVEHDDGKRREDWITLITYLVGKAAKAHFDEDTGKLKHHVVTIAAVCLNWLRAENGESNVMRPGIG